MTHQQPHICILGCGNIGALHAKHLRCKAQLYFCSRSRFSALKLNAKFRGNGIFTDFASLLKSDVDAVVIASPPQYHKEQVIALLATGKAVMVEKPLCISPKEVADIETALAQMKKPLLMIAENYYYKPSLSVLKQMIKHGDVGEVQSIFIKKLTTQKSLGWKRDLGALLEGGIHFVAWITDLFDAAPKHVEATFPGYCGKGPERESLVRMTSLTGCVAQLHYSWQTPSLTKGLLQHSYIKGSQGRIVFESNGIYIHNPRRNCRISMPGLRDVMGYNSMTTDFLSCLQNRNRQPYSNFDRAKRDLQIVFDAYACLGG